MRLRATRLGVASGGAEIPLPRRVRNILSKFQATGLIAGASGVAVHSFALGNYIESTGQTLTPVDGAVGLAVDAAGTVGPELFTDAAVTTVGGSSRVSPGVYRVYSPDGSYSSVNLAFGLTVGKHYKVEFNIDSVSIPGIGFQLEGATLVVSSPAVGKFSCVVSPSQTHIGVKRGGGVLDMQISGVSVRELPGNHATQPTTQNKPVLRRGLVNLLTYSNDFSNAAWTTKLRVSISGQTLTATESTGNGFLIGRSSATQFGQTTVAILLEKGSRDNCVINLWDGTNGTRRWFNLATVEPGHSMSFGSGVTAVQASAVALPDGKRIISFTANIASGTPQLTFYPSVDSATGFGCTAGEFGIVHAVATFQGTVTAEQILAAGGIPVTTSAPASSAVGPYFWRFDPIDDALLMTFPAGTGWDSTTIITGRATGQVTQTAQNVQGAHSITGGGDMYCRFYVPNGGNLSASELQAIQRFADRVAGVA